MKEEDLKGTSRSYYNNVANPPDENSRWIWETWFMGPTSPFVHVMEALEKDMIFVDNFAGAPTATMVDRWGTLEELRRSSYTRIIVGDLDADSGFDEFAQSWLDLGGKQITEEVSAWYRANK